MLTWKGQGASQADVTLVTGMGRAGKTGELVCGGGIFKGEVLAGQPNGKGEFFISQVHHTCLSNWCCSALHFLHEIPLLT